jgi:hypothetical protein
VPMPTALSTSMVAVSPSGDFVTNLRSDALVRASAVTRISDPLPPIASSTAAALSNMDPQPSHLSGMDPQPSRLPAADPQPSHLPDVDPPASGFAATWHLPQGLPQEHRAAAEAAEADDVLLAHSAATQRLRLSVEMEGARQRRAARLRVLARRQRLAARLASAGSGGLDRQAAPGTGLRPLSADQRRHGSGVAWE